jgi:AraC-like DNA-binding protein
MKATMALGKSAHTIHAEVELPEPLAAKSQRARAETPMAFVKAIVRAYERRGMSPVTALTAAQITPSLLSRPRAKITALQMELLSGAAMQELDDEALGWFSRRLPWGSYGMLVRASLTAPTLGLALARWCRHHNLLTDDIHLQVTRQEALARIELQELRPLGEFQEFCIVSVLRNALGVACWLSDSRIALLGNTLQFAQPPHRSSYEVLFDGPTTFKADGNALLFDAGYLSLPVRRDEAALQRMLDRALLLTVRPYRRDRLLVEKVRQTLALHLFDIRTADDLAARLNLSARTLHRQLKEEGSSLQQLKDAVRRDMAMDLLNRSNRGIKQIAQAVGFQNEKSFMRAFKTWTGQTPDALRKRNPAR